MNWEWTERYNSLEPVLYGTHIECIDTETGNVIPKIKIDFVTIDTPPDDKQPGELTATYVGFKDGVKYEATCVFDRMVCENGKYDLVEREDARSLRTSRDDKPCNPFE